ncbi:MAG: hypothetical protein NE330_04655 [Lentisphaeraceae bacterium]|nr:hypothetical protein [Lentisphaeraceae bacterium]
MIISRTPFRISFFGGGSDYPAFYQEHDGSVLNTSINKYCYLTCRYLPPFFEHKFRIRYTRREETQIIDEIQHPSVRACLNHLNFGQGVEILHTSDIPAMSGIGSSSSFTVGLLKALHALQNRMRTKEELCNEALTIEQDILKENVGSQDQVAAAFGGLNRIDFSGKRTINVSPMTISSDKVKHLQNHLMLFFTGFSRIASHIAQEQIECTPHKTSEISTLKQMVDQAVDILSSKNIPLNDFGELLHESWLLKKSLTSKITTPEIDAIYETAKRSGAIGGKLCGAGGGGFMLLFVPPEKQLHVKVALKQLIHVPFDFEELGSQIIYQKATEKF